MKSLIIASYSGKKKNCQFYVKWYAAMHQLLCAFIIGIFLISTE